MAAETASGIGRARRIGVWLGVPAAGLAAVALAYAGLTRDLGPRTEDGGLDLSRHVLEPETLVRTVVATGQLEPVSRVPVKSEVSGVIRHVHVREGDRVRRGETLFEVDRERLEDRVNALRAALEMKRAAARYDLVGRAGLEVERARREHARVESLYRTGAAAQRELDQSLHDLKLAEVGLRDARAERAARHAAVLEAEHLLHQAEKDVERSLVRAPIDGLVVERPAELGAVVADVTASGGTLLAVVADDQRIRLVAEVDENDIAQVARDQRARITIDAFPDETFEGRVRRVSSSGLVEEHVASFEVEIELPADPRLRVGMSADARIAVDEYRDVLLVPNAAIVRQNGDPPRVRRAGAGSDFTLTDVREGYSDGFRTVLEAGVAAGDVVLVPEVARD